MDLGARRWNKALMGACVDVDYGTWGGANRLSPRAFFASTTLPDGITVIDWGTVELPLLIRQIGSPATFYGFHAAMHPVNRRTLPFFQGRRVAPAGLNSVLVCDPSLFLHPEVTVGWFLGNRTTPLLDILPAVMAHLDRVMGATRRLLWGNSAGGTAALVHARAEDVSVAINPQILLENFTWSRVRPWARHGWGAGDKSAQLAVVRDLGDVRNRPPDGRIVYVQNSSDDHVDRHLDPFRAVADLPDTPGDNGRHRLVMGHWGDGHIPPAAPIQHRILTEEARRLLGEMGARISWRERLRDRLPLLGRMRAAG